MWISKFFVAFNLFSITYMYCLFRNKYQNQSIECIFRFNIEIIHYPLMLI